MDVYSVSHLGSHTATFMLSSYARLSMHLCIFRHSPRASTISNCDDTIHSRAGIDARILETHEVDMDATLVADA
jgi:hypothetical protein